MSDAERRIQRAVKRAKVAEDDPFTTIQVYIADLESLLADLDAARAELAEALTDMVQQECWTSDTQETGRYDSCAISSRADAMRRLAEMGRFVIESEVGRRVIGHFIDAPPAAEGRTP